MQCISVETRPDGQRSLDDPFGIYRTVMSGDIVILKNAVPAADCLRAREAVFSWGRSEPTSKDYALQVRKNVHLNSYLPPKSEARYIFHSYEFYFGDSGPQSGLNNTVRPVFDRLKQIYRELTGSPYDYAPMDGYALLPQCIQYPQGGGFFQEHLHQIAPQQIGLILAASEIGTDYEVGSVRFRGTTDTTWTDTEGQHRIGDICLFRYDLPHDITPVDPHVPLDWTKNSGRWSFILPVKPAPQAK